jgi:long-chain acyl-CoA synthetase
LGKYQRFLLPDLYAGVATGVVEALPPQISDEDRQLLASPIAGGAWEIILTRYARRRPTLDAHLVLDLGVDSLEWMGLSLELESKLHVFIPEDDMARIDTVRDLLGALVKSGAQPPAKARTRQQRTLADRERWLRPRGPVLTLIGLFLFALNKIAMRLLFRLRVQGFEHLPATGPLLLAPNHVSDLDPLAIAASLDFARLSRVYWAGDVTRLFGNPVLRLLCRAVHLFPVDERMPESATEMAALVLSHGDTQVWFPEGWRSPDGRLQPFRPGVGSLLLRSKVPAVPIYISGTFQALPRNRRWPRLQPIRVVIGAPVDLEALRSRGQGKGVEERMANALQAEVRALAATIGEEV